MTPSVRPRDVVVAIHQPNFLPWLGYFDKMARSDVFVILDSVQFPKSGQGNWTNRVQILLQGRAHWLTVPVDRSFHGVRSIREMQIAEDSTWREKMIRTLHAEYRKASHFDAVMPVVEELLHVDTRSISDFNTIGVTTLAKRLIGRPPRFVQSSDLGVEGRATELLIGLTKAVHGTIYLCGGGAAGYQEDDRLREAGLEVRYQKFSHPRYAQLRVKESVPGLSIVDALFNIGFEGTAKLLTGTVMAPSN